MTTLLVVAALIAPVQDFVGHTREVSSLAVSPDGKWLASGSVDLTVRIWDAKTRQCVKVLEGHDGEVKCLAFSPDGKTLASGEQYKKVRFWDVASGALQRTVTGYEGAVNGIVFLPGGGLAAACQDNNVWKVGPDGTEAKVGAKHKFGVAGISASSDSKAVVSIDENGTAMLWDSSNLMVRAIFEQGGRGKCVAVSPDGKWFATGGTENPVQLWSASSTPAPQFGGPKVEANALAFSPDGKRLVVGTQDNEVLVVDTAGGAVKFRKEGHERPVTAVAVSPDGKTFYTASMDMKVKSWPMP
ncbi:MAG: WD40 repeat domain-containing protein [Armatimonadetes bacterium]|nr:WD40 repeat domain-containing protein [Armatimonadota bacterium]